MLNPEQVPDEVEEHFRWCAANTDMTTRECIAAAINAWPGMANCKEDYLGPACLILPLPAEAHDE